MLNSNTKKLLLLCLAVLVMAGIFLSGLHKTLTLSGLQSISGSLHAYVSVNPLQSIAVAFVAMAFIYMLPLPTAALVSMTAGFVFNFKTGLLLVLFSSLLAACITFIIARYIARDWIQEKFARYMSMIDSEIEAHGFLYALGIRMVPGIPFIALNSSLGITPLSLKAFSLSTILGMIPISAVLVNAGSQLNTIQSVADIMTPKLLISLLLLASFPFIVRLLKSLIIKKAT